MLVRVVGLVVVYDSEEIVQSVSELKTCLVLPRKSTADSFGVLLRHVKGRISGGG